MCVCEVFCIFDYSGVYVLIVGIYMLYSLLVIKGWLGWMILLMIWILVIVGIMVNVVWFGCLKKVEMVIYVLMGWMCFVGGW